MHHCLGIEEIVDIVVESLLEGLPNRVGYSSVASLARTCRTFLEPALNGLWKVQLNLLPLAMCLPADAVTLVVWDRSYGFRVPKITRTLTTSDWERFDYYAQRVVRLGIDMDQYNSATQEEISRTFEMPGRPVFVDLDEFHSDLLTARQDHLYLPNIRHLIWKHKDGLTIRAMAGPKLSTLSWMIDHSSWDLIIPSLQFLYNQSPQLQSLHVLGVARFDASCQLLSVHNTLSHFRHLRVFKCPWGLSAHILAQLASLPNLENINARLAISLAAAKVKSLLACVAQETPFPSLRILNIYAPWDTTKCLLDILPEDRLSQLHYLYRAPTNTSPRAETTEARNKSLKDLCESTGGRFSRSLTTLVIRIPVPRLTWEAVHPLLALRKIETFEFYAPFFPALEDGFIGELASAWPNLKQLLLDDVGLEESPKVTVQGLFSIMSRCPQLECLGIPFNACDTDFPPLDPPIQNDHIKTIIIGRFLLPADTLPLAAWLSDVLPQLQAFRFGRHSDIEGREDWDIVLKQCRLLVSVRQQERDRLARNGS